jgi:hypothetical protein
MEESGLVNKKLGRINLASLILFSCFFIIIITLLINFATINKMGTRGTVKGVLKNNAGRPVANAIVMIKEGTFEFNDIASISNEKGEFYVSDIVIPGRYVLQIKHETGQFTKEINVESANTMITINF